jgi:hypothetical protein
MRLHTFDSYLLEAFEHDVNVFARGVGVEKSKWLSAT